MQRLGPDNVLRVHLGAVVDRVKPRELYGENSGILRPHNSLESQSVLLEDDELPVPIGESWGSWLPRCGPSSAPS